MRSQRAQVDFNGALRKSHGAQRMPNGRLIKHRQARSVGDRCIWPSGVQKRYGISAPTRWRWEKLNLLPARDVFIGGVPKGWKPETLDAADSNPVAA